jgi:hypothetical protein
MANILYCYISTSKNMRIMPSMPVFCSSLMSGFPDIVQVFSEELWDISTFVFTYHMHCIYIVRFIL